MLVKVCGFLDAANLGDVLRLQPTWVGFNFYRLSPRYVDPEASLFGVSTGEVRRVGVFVNEPLVSLVAIVEACCLDVVQLHGDESPDFVQNVRSALPGIEVWKVLRVASKESLQLTGMYDSLVDLYLLDSSTKGYGGSGKSFDWQLVREVRWKKPFLLSGGIGVSEVSRLPKVDNLVGIDVCSKVEQCPGVKDVNKVSELIKAVAGL